MFSFVLWLSDMTAVPMLGPVVLPNVNAYAGTGGSAFSDWCVHDLLAEDRIVSAYVIECLSSKLKVTGHYLGFLRPVVMDSVIS